MQGPTGFSGVHTVRKSGQSLGAMMPRSTSPQRQPFGSCVGSTSGLEVAHGVEARELLAECGSPEPSMRPRPRQKAGHVSNTLVDGGQRGGIALRHDAARVGDLDLGAALVQLAHDHRDALQHVHRLETP